ncbi:MAG: DUF2158 domain-containing protein [FCB group bacterium]|nr:DUF2158 domain-containing protein [FCB group bacterium]MBL7029453.1 DUF2158 domain-containing protein [Candidatus Neomarinimicrobiota bacterium]
MEIKIGSVVQLKSGGPLLTVSSVENRISCQWFDESGALQRGAFRREQLKVIEVED